MKVDAKLLEQARSGAVRSFFVDLNEQADLSGAAALVGKQEKGRYVFERLREVATRTQPAVAQAVREAGLEPIPFYIINTILAVSPRGDAVSESQLAALASRADVARVLPLGRAEAPPEIRSTTGRIGAYSDTAPNIVQIGASHLQDRGIDGRGLVVGVSDSGEDWTHPAIQSRYRGFSETGTTHDYNWFDPTEEHSRAPLDTNGHGTHVTAIAVGGPPGDRVGVAPGAKWIGCRGIGPGSSRQSVLACLQFFLAPTDVNGNNPDPDLSPDITNHSYICPFCELEPAFQALKDAGIMAVVGSGNFGPECGSVFDPGTYSNVLSVGAVDQSGAIAEFSSRGPVENISIKPEIVAPGADIRSATPSGEYDTLSGTSQATPHVAGAIALLWNARPDLRGDVSATIDALLQAAKPSATSECESDTTKVINNVYGHGVLNLDPFVPPASRRRAVRK